MKGDEEERVLDVLMKDSSHLEEEKIERSMRVNVFMWKNLMVTHFAKRILDSQQTDLTHTLHGPDQSISLLMQLRRMIIRPSKVIDLDH